MTRREGEEQMIHFECDYLEGNYSAYTWRVDGGRNMWKTYETSPAVMKYSVIHILIGLLAYFTTVTVSGYAYWVFGIGLTLVSMLFSLMVLHQKTHLWERLKQKYFSFLNKRT